MSDNRKQIKLKRLARSHRTRMKIRSRKLRPRLSVFRSDKHIYAQIIDDVKGHTIVSSSTMAPGFKKLDEKLTGIKAAEWVGKDIAEKALSAGIKQVVFDRGRYLYHGRVKALAEKARENGLEF